MSQLYELYKQLGNEGYGAAIGKIAPYFSTISPNFVELRQGYCEITVVNQVNVHNHLGSVHAIAMCNGAELVAGLVTDVSIPNDKRWIPVGMTVRYLTMAKHDLRIFTNCENVDWNQDGDIDIDVEAHSGEETAMEAKITMRISDKKNP